MSADGRRKLSQVQRRWRCLLLGALGIAMIYGLCTSRALARRPRIRLLWSKVVKPATYEALASTSEMSIEGLTLRKLDRCLLLGAAHLDRRRSSARNFGKVHWTEEEHETLAECDPGDCRYDFSAPRVRRLSRQKTLAARKRLYYKLLRESALHADKRKKRSRIRVKHLRYEPCAHDPEFVDLLHGALHARDTVVWRKVYRERLFPTVLIMQSRRWTKGSRWCRARTMLFADHYYRDHVELFQFWRTGPNKLKLRFHSRSRVPMNTVWRRSFRGMIADRMRDAETKRVLRILGRCR